MRIRAAHERDDAVDADFDLSIPGFGQASEPERGAEFPPAGGSDGGHFLTVFADSVAVASVDSATTPAESDLDIFGSRIANSPMARRPLSGGTVTSVLAGEVHNRGSAGAGRRSR